MSENELKARKYLAQFAQAGVRPAITASIVLTDEECKNIAKNLPWHWEDVRAYFKSDMSARLV